MGLIIIDILSFSISLIIAYEFREFFILNTFSLQPLEFNILLNYYWVPIIYLIFIAYEGLYTRRDPFWEEARTLITTLTLSTLAIFVFVSLMQMQYNISRSLIVLFWLISMFIFPVFRFYGKRLLYNLNIWNEPILIIGNNEAGKAFAEEMIKMKFLGYEVIGFIDNNITCKNEKVQISEKTFKILGRVEDYCSISKRYQTNVALIALPNINEIELSTIVANIQQCARRVIIVPRTKGIATQNTKLLHMFSRNTFLLEVNNNLKKSINQFWKKTFDILLALILLPILLLVFVIIGVLIKIVSRGTVLFSQKRQGQYEKDFNCFKFQTMYDDNDTILEQYLAENKEASKEWKKYKKLRSYDPRVTRIGAILRKTSLDELPQIINILKGEMSFVGPRPYLHKEREEMGEYASFILESKPGITGLWQVSGRNELEFDERVKLDTWYVLNWSLWSDVFILLKTIKVVLKREGAY